MNWFQKIAIAFPSPGGRPKPKEPNAPNWRNLNSVYNKHTWDRLHEIDDHDDKVWSYEDNHEHFQDNTDYNSIGQTHNKSDIWKIDFENYDELPKARISPNEPLRFSNVNFSDKTFEEIPMENRHEGILDYPNVDINNEYSLAHGWVDHLSKEGSVNLHPANYKNMFEIHPNTVKSILDLVQSKYPNVQFFVWDGSGAKRVPSETYLQQTGQN